MKVSNGKGIYLSCKKTIEKEITKLTCLSF